MKVGNTMSEVETAGQSDPKLRGYLVIYVDAYKTCMKNAAWIVTDSDGKTVSVPDRLMPPPRHEVGSMTWWEEGWAVGDNARDRLCMRAGSKPLRQFKDFDEPVAYTYRRQQKFKSHQHVLVYVTAGIGGKPRSEVVRSMDDIEAFEARIQAEIDENDRLLAEQRAKWDKELPHLKMLQERFGMSVGWALSDFLRNFRKKRRDAAKAGVSKSTYYRYVKMLREVGLVE